LYKNSIFSISMSTFIVTVFTVSLMVSVSWKRFRNIIGGYFMLTIGEVNAIAYIYIYVKINPNIN